MLPCCLLRKLYNLCHLIPLQEYQPHLDNLLSRHYLNTSPPARHSALNNMKASSAIAVVFAVSIYKASATSLINTRGVATSCGQNTCCIPSCLLNWSDGNGCDGQAETASACSGAFTAASSTTDTGVDICDGSGAFFCGTTGGGRAVFVANDGNVISAVLFPAVYNECTLSGQCAGCEQQASCQDAVTIGTSTEHNCAAFNSLLTSSGVNLKQC